MVDTGVSRCWVLNSGSLLLLFEVIFLDPCVFLFVWGHIQRCSEIMPDSWLRKYFWWCWGPGRDAGCKANALLTILSL